MSNNTSSLSVDLNHTPPENVSTTEDHHQEVNIQETIKTTIQPISSEHLKSDDRKTLTTSGGGGSIRIIREYNPITSTFVFEPATPGDTKPFSILDTVTEEFGRDDNELSQEDIFESQNNLNMAGEDQTKPTIPNSHLESHQRPKQPFYKLIGYCIYYVGSGSTSSFVLGLLLQKLVVQMLGEKNKELHLSIVVSIATIIGVIVSPVIGNLSDRIGRKSRIPIVVVTTLLWGLSIVLQSICSLMHTQFPQYYILIFVMYTCVLCIGKCGYVTSQAIITAMVTDLFPQEQINLVSALVGVFTLVGVMLGVVLGGIIITHIALIWVCLGYATLCTLVCIPLFLFHKELSKAVPKVEKPSEEQPEKPTELDEVPLASNQDSPLPNESGISIEPTPKPKKPSIFRRGWNYAKLFLVPFKNRNFTWVFITRFTIQLTNAAARNYFFYFIHDVLTPYNFVLTDKFPTSDEEALSLFLGIVFVFTFVSALFSQKLASLIGRRFIYSGGALSCGVASIILIIFRSYSVMILVCSILYGLGIGSFISVDLSLVNSVLVDRDDSGKDLALWNISGTGK